MTTVATTMPAGDCACITTKKHTYKELTSPRITNLFFLISPELDNRMDKRNTSKTIIWMTKLNSYIADVRPSP